VNCVAALRFFFVKTLKRHQFREFLPYPKDRRRQPDLDPLKKYPNVSGLKLPQRLHMAAE